MSWIKNWLWLQILLLSKRHVDVKMVKTLPKSGADNSATYPLHFVLSFLAGGVSASIAITAIAPLERVKLILQTQKGATNIPKELEYKGLIDCLVRLRKDEGFFSLWRGNWAGIMRAFPYQAMSFSTKEILKDKIVPKPDGFKQTLRNNILIGGLAGATALTTIYPLDYARTRMALDVGAKGKRKYRGVIHCITSSVQRYGVRFMYRGYFFAVLGAFVYRALYFGLYDTIIECVQPRYSRALWVELMAAEFAAISSGIVTYPMDSVRRRLMVQDLPTAKGVTLRKNVIYHGTIDCAKKIWKGEGIRGFFHGALVNMFRGTGGAIMLVTYDNIQNFLFQNYPEIFPTDHIKHEHQAFFSNEELVESDLDASFTIKPCKIFKPQCVFCNM